jgi:signal transduction histidine kinase
MDNTSRPRQAAALPAPAERRRAQRVLGELRAAMVLLPRSEFHHRIARALLDILPAHSAFLARLPARTGDGRVETLAYLTRGFERDCCPVAPSVEMNEGQILAACAASLQGRMDEWLRSSGWLGDAAPAALIALPLRACSGATIGFLGAAGGDSEALREPGNIADAAAVARLAERVVELDQTLADLERDIRERSRTETALRESENLFRRMFESMSEAVVVHDFVFSGTRVIDYLVIDANPAFEQHTGVPVSEVRGKHGSEIFHGIPPFLEQFNTVAAGGGPVSFETYLESAQRRLRVSAFSIGGDRFVAVFQDVTRQRRLEQEDRARAQELGRTGGLLTLGEMASTLAHELNQPLTAIANFSAGSLARIDAGKTSLEQLRGILAEINGESERAGRILKGIRRFMEKHEFHPTPMDVNSLVLDVIGLPGAVPQDGSFALQLDLAPQLPQVQADRVLAQVVLVNLMRNGVEAMQENVDAPRELRLTTVVNEGGCVEIAVRDTGCGIPEDADAVFQAFFTTKTGGVGLGLAIARSIVESHGGRIWATRNASRGSTFHFTLCARKGAAPAGG